MPNDSPNPNKMSNHCSSSTPPIPKPDDDDDDEDYLSKSEYLTRREVIERRSKMLKRLTKIYKDYYWSLMEELKVKYREYYMEYGRSPFVEDQEGDENAEEREMCGAQGCKSKAMPLTKFCHAHILSDTKQKLYKPCGYTLKSSPTGSILCGKPILTSAIPSLCTIHLQKAEKLIARDLKDAGFNGNHTSKPAPKFHVLTAEFVRQIQTKRRAAQKAATERTELKEDDNSL